MVTGVSTTDAAVRVTTEKEKKIPFYTLCKHKISNFALYGNPDHAVWDLVRCPS
jgi:hypothetical protein